MEAIVEKLEAKLSQWKPEISAEVRSLISEVINAADEDALDLVRSRTVEQEVLDRLDEPASR
jgi:RPA family protein